MVAFNDYLPRLCKATREYFDDDENWSEAKKDLFREFNADNFVDSELRDDKNLNNTIERLKDKETSLGFYNFLAKNVGYTSGYKVFPVISACNSSSTIHTYEYVPVLAVSVTNNV